MFCIRDCDTDTDCDTDRKTEFGTETGICFSHFFNKIQAEKQVSLLFEPFNWFVGHFGAKIAIWYVIYSKI